MDIKLLLAKSITLLFQTSQIDATGDLAARDLIKEAFEYIKLPDSVADDGIERNSIIHLRSTLLWMLATNESQAYDKNDLLQRVRLNVGSDDKLYSAFVQGIVVHENTDTCLKSVNRIKKDLKKFVAQEKVKKIFKAAHHEASFKSTGIDDWTVFVSNAMNQLGQIDVGSDVKADPAFVMSVDFSLRESVSAAFKEMEDSLSDEGSIRMPFQGGNRMMGDRMAMRRGEFHLYNALPGNYKSGWLMDILIGACLFNDPYCFDPSKQAAAVLFSTEDDVPLIIQKIFVIIKQIETGLPVLVKKFTNDYMTDYVMEKLQARGWKVFIHRVIGSRFTFHKYIATLEDYKARGFELALVICDYLHMFSKEGCRRDSTGDDVQDLFRRIREYTAPNRILHCTAHQLSTAVKDLKRENPNNYIKDLPGKGYYESCKRLDTEVDFEAYLNKAVTPQGTFQELVWGKHRKVGATLEKHKYVVFKYHEPPMYGLIYDIDGDDQSLTAVGGKPLSEGGGRSWQDLEDFS